MLQLFLIPGRSNKFDQEPQRIKNKWLFSPWWGWFSMVLHMEWLEIGSTCSPPRLLILSSFNQMIGHAYTVVWAPRPMSFQENTGGCFHVLFAIIYQLVVKHEVLPLTHEGGGDRSIIRFDHFTNCKSQPSLDFNEDQIKTKGKNRFGHR